MKTPFKEKDAAYFLILLKGKVNIANKLIRKPEFIVMEGKVATICQLNGDDTTCLSLEVPRWPLRYLIPPQQCFKNKHDAEELADKENDKLAQQTRFK